MMLLDFSKKSKENGLNMILVSMKGGALENNFKNLVSKDLLEKCSLDGLFQQMVSKINKKYKLGL